MPRRKEKWGEVVKNCDLKGSPRANGFGGEKGSKGERVGKKPSKVKSTGFGLVWEINPFLYRLANTMVAFVSMA